MQGIWGASRVSRNVSGLPRAAFLEVSGTYRNDAACTWRGRDEEREGDMSIQRKESSFTATRVLQRERRNGTMIPVLITLTVAACAEQ